MEGNFVNEHLKYLPSKLDGEGTLQILLVSTNQSYLDKISKSIYETREIQNEKRSYSLKVHICKTIIEVIQFMPTDFHVDFIVFIIETHLNNCLVEVQTNLSYLDSSFTREKLCIVNADFNYQKAAVSPLEVQNFYKCYQLNLINGKTKDQESLFNLSKRILNLAEACCGILNGIPMV